jgi:hypothetical protein
MEMSEIWKPLDIDVYKSWIQSILDEASDSLNDWESNFISNIDNQLTSGRILTQSQAEKLESIYNEKTS